MKTRSDFVSMIVIRECALLVVVLTAPAAAQVTTRVSVDSLGAQSSSGTGAPSISADGRWVAFSSFADNLVPGDTNGTWDIFVHDRVSGTTERVSVDSLAVQGNGASSFPPTISADGRWVAFRSSATNLVAGDTNGFDDIFVRDRANGSTERVSVDSFGAQANHESTGVSISADGGFVAFTSFATNLVAGDTNGIDDIFVRDRANGVTERVSVDSLGTQALGSSFKPTISAGGRFVAFQSFSVNLVPGDTNGLLDVFLRDRTSGTTERVSVSSLGAQANNLSTDASVSADGSIVAFRSNASNLVSGDTNASGDVFVRDRSNATTERVSLGSLGAQANGASSKPVISADGRFVAFLSTATNLVVGDTNGNEDAFLRDRTSGMTERVSIDSLGAQANGHSTDASISADGRCVAFLSGASNLVPSDTNAFNDVFARVRLESGSAFCSPGADGVLACPCAPGTDAAHGPGHGCSNSIHTVGGVLVGTGAPAADAASDTLVLTATEITNSLTIFVAGSSRGSGLAVGDGVRCVSGTLIRFGTTIASARTASYPDDAGDAPISVVTGALAGETKYYQALYRNAADWCNSATFNMTSGYVIVWQ